MASQVKRPSALSCAPKAQSWYSTSIIPDHAHTSYPRLSQIPDYPIFDYPRSLDKDEPGQAGTVPLSQVSQAQSQDAGIISSQ